jgi:hypothetical protein
MLCSQANNDIFLELIKITVIFNLYKDGWHIVNIDKNCIEIKKNRVKGEDIELDGFLNKYLIRAFS